MFKSTGNNFGGPEITFKDYQGEHEIVLNAVFDYDSTNEAYRNARQLEIYVPALRFNKSAVAGCFFAAEGQYGPLGTTVKTWIKNKNTIVIEKLTAWDNLTNHRIYICTMYGLRGFRGIAFERLKAAGISLQMSNSIGYPRDQVYYVTPDWMFLNFSLGSPSIGANNKICFLSNYNDFPDDIDALLPYVSGYFDYRNPGTNVHPVRFKDSQILITDLPKQMSSGTGWDSLFYAFIVRDRDNTPDVPGRLLWQAKDLIYDRYVRIRSLTMELSPFPAIVYAEMESGLSNKTTMTYEVEGVPEAMAGFKAFFLGTYTGGKCLTIQLVELQLVRENGKDKFTTSSGTGLKNLIFQLFDTSVAMPVNA